MNRKKKIFVAGHAGLVGSAIVRQLRVVGDNNILTRTREELDLTTRNEVDSFFASERPDYVVLAAARVGGIYANTTFPADFIYNNLAIQVNVIDAAYRSGVEKFLFLGSSCIYPKNAPQPLKEEYLLTSPLEPTNEAYAISKIAGIKMCQAYRSQYGFDAISVMPTNLYGPNDNFDLYNSHVLPALMRKFHEAKMTGAESVKIWGSGNPKREFLHVDDLAEACVFILSEPSERVFKSSSEGILNIGPGEDISIKNLANLIGELVGFRGPLEFDSTKPDGTTCKLLDVSRVNELGWKAKISLRDGIKQTYDWYKQNYEDSAFSTEPRLRFNQDRLAV